MPSRRADPSNQRQISPRLLSASRLGDIGSRLGCDQLGYLVSAWELARVFATDADAYRPSKTLLVELDSRKQALQTFRRERIYLGERAKMNIEMRAARGTDQLVQRIAHLETILEERGDL